MKLLLRFFFLSISLVWTQIVVAQVATSVNPSSLGKKRDYAMDTVYSVKKIREDYKMYQISVWRRIDLKEKYNLDLYGSGDTKENGIISNIYKGIIDNKLPVFADENFTKPLSITKFDSAFSYNDVKDTVFFKNYYYLDFKEDYVFDRQHSQFKFDIKYIQLVRPSEFNQGAFEQPVAYIRYKDFIEYFKNHPTAKWINFRNPAEPKTYSQAFEERLFRSYVKKFTNVNDASVFDLVSANTPADRKRMQEALDGLAFEYKLLDFENSLWEW